MLPNTTLTNPTLIVRQKFIRPAVLPSDTLLHGKVKAPSQINRLYPSFNRTHFELKLQTSTSNSLTRVCVRVCVWR